MIHLSFATFLGLADEGEDESFRAHEMAHQWWGIGVEPASYRDAWLSEGFAEFSGMWYMQIIPPRQRQVLQNAAPIARRDPAPTGQGGPDRPRLSRDGELARELRPHHVSEGRLGAAHDCGT